MHLSLITTFFQTYAFPLSIITIGACLYWGIITWLSRMPWRQTFTLFLTGIIVITCIFLPFTWSLNNAGGGKEVSLFFFHVNIEGNNFISLLRHILLKNTYIQMIQSYYFNGRNVVDDAVVIFLAFLEELAKLVLLILCIKKSLRMPVILVYCVLVFSVFHHLVGMDTSTLMLVGTGVVSFIGLVILWKLLSTPIRTESVSDYIYSIALVAIGFAFAENIKYMLDLSAAGNNLDAITSNALLRSVFGYLSHTFFSMVCVSLYARGRFAFLRVIDDLGTLSLGQKALGWKNYTSIKSIQGFWTGVVCASFIHGIYNIYISTNVLVPSVILLIGFIFLELFVLHDLRNNTKYGHIENYMQ